jgi:hypothetical protein
MSWTANSLNGLKVTFVLLFVKADASVVKVGMWQTLQPMFSKAVRPALVEGCRRRRGREPHEACEAGDTSPRVTYHWLNCRMIFNKGYTP